MQEHEQAAKLIPDGFVPFGWYGFPSGQHVWSPSKLHLAAAEQVATGKRPYESLCGLSPSRSRPRIEWSRNQSPAAYGRIAFEFARDAGVCQRCLTIALTTALHTDTTERARPGGTETRPSYAYQVACSCGHHEDDYLTKAQALTRWRAHVRQAVQQLIDEAAR
jgi:hypothetical protein